MSSQRGNGPTHRMPPHQPKLDWRRQMSVCDNRIMKISVICAVARCRPEHLCVPSPNTRSHEEGGRSVMNLPGDRIARRSRKADMVAASTTESLLTETRRTSSAPIPVSRFT